VLAGENGDRESGGRHRQCLGPGAQRPATGGQNDGRPIPGQGPAGRGLRKSYRNRPVIRDVAMTLDRGEVVALLGPNGSGKTTCFYCIAGLVAPDSGQVYIDGQDVTALPMYRRAQMGIGYLPQEMSIFRG
jgi:lipopolysaccharide export system ATP-binding protein